MNQQTPFFMLKAKDVLIIILTIIGLGLLFVYGSRAIASANDPRYVEGWQSRPFMPRPTNTVPVTSAKQSVPVTKASQIETEQVSPQQTGSTPTSAATPTGNGATKKSTNARVLSVPKSSTQKQRRTTSSNDSNKAADYSLLPAVRKVLGGLGL